ncbi:MAG TPA: NAD-binding protein [Anaerolineales bacterium]|nr:NAD-binding protein [Anaerolineales bacterium]
MKIIIVGCGRVGAELAYRLFQRGHQVTIIDDQAAAFRNLRPDFRGRTLEGEVLSQDIQRQAGFEEADGLAAVTNSDSLNAVVAHIARALHRIPQVVVRNYSPDWRPLHEAFGHQVVSSSSWGAQRIEELLYHAELRTVFSAGNGEVEVYEFRVPDSWAGRTMRELLPEQQCLPMAVTRAGRATHPASEALLEKGDLVLLSATLEGIEALRHKLAESREG